MKNITGHEVVTMMCIVLLIGGVMFCTLWGLFSIRYRRRNIQ